MQNPVPTVMSNTSISSSLSLQGCQFWLSFYFATIRKRSETSTHEAGVEMTTGVADVPSTEVSSMLTSSSVMLPSNTSAAAAAATVNKGCRQISHLQWTRSTLHADTVHSTHTLQLGEREKKICPSVYQEPCVSHTAGKSTHSEAVYLLNWLSLAGPRPIGVRVSRCCPRCSVVAPPVSCAAAARWCSEGPCDSCLPDGKTTAKQSDRQKEGSNPCSGCNFVYAGFYTGACVCQLGTGLGLGWMELRVGSNIIQFLYILLLLTWYMYFTFFVYIVHC